MARRSSEEEYLSPEIVNRGVEGSGPYAGSPSFSVRVHRGLPDFLSSANLNLKYVKLGITREEYIELAKKSGQFNEKAIEFQHRVLKTSGIGDETYLPRVVFRPGYTRDLTAGREEATAAMFGAVDELIAATGIRPKDLRILIVNCGVLNTTPSLSAMVINRYKLRHNIQSYNLGGMGCAAGITAVDLADDLLKAYPGSYALIVSTEVVSFTWYGGNDLDMLLPNCFFRMGAAAVLLSNNRLEQWRSKYQLKQVAHIPLYLYPFLNTTSKSRPFEYLRLTSLGIIGALVKVDDTEVISFLLSTEIIPLCLRTMEMGSELSKTVETFIIQKILLDDVGLEYICTTAERFFVVGRVLANMVAALAEQPSSRILKHIIRCYLRLSDNPRSVTASGDLC
ncbi:hypothetical protein OROHE_009200 [Orobanche hederae]